MRARSSASVRSADDHRRVRAERRDPVRGLAQAAGQVVVLLEGACDDRDVGALGRQPFGDGGTDATARAGDERPSTCEARRTHGSTASAVAQM